MLKYLVILLDSTSVSFCHYNNTVDQPNLIPEETLRRGILFALKRNLRIQYIFPHQEIPEYYYKIISNSFYDIIAPSEHYNVSDVVIFDSINDIINTCDNLALSKRYVLRISYHDIINHRKELDKLVNRGLNFNIVYTDVEQFDESDVLKYENALSEIGESIVAKLAKGINVNTNILTDRIALQSMNNCGAGDTSITLAPDGNFYPCPAFYYYPDKYCYSGDIISGLDIKAQRLYTIEAAPLCRRCDAFHCKRCIWLNKRLTLELNIPSRQQCVMSHIERNASKDMLDKLHEQSVLCNRDMNKINYLDPFDNFLEK